MKALRNSLRAVLAFIVAALASVLPMAAHATTDCSGTVYTIWHETGSTAKSYGQLVSSSGKGFSLPVTDAGYAGVFTLLHQAKAIGLTVNVRFAASGVNCSTYEWRTDLVAIWL